MDSGADNTNSRHVRFFTGTATEQAYRVSRQIVGTALFLALCMWSFIGWSLWSEYSVTRTTSRTQEFNLIAAFSGELTLTLDSVSGALRLIQNEIAAMPPSAPPASVQARLERATRDMPGLAQDICVAGPDGKVLFSTLRPDAGRPDPGKPDLAPADVHEKPSFIRHRDDPNAGLIIDPPDPTAEGPRRLITVSRRLETADGQFAGEAMLLMKPGSLINLQHEIDLGRRGMVSIVGTDGHRSGWLRPRSSRWVGRGGHRPARCAVSRRSAPGQYLQLHAPQPG